MTTIGWPLDITLAVLGVAVITAGLFASLRLYGGPEVAARFWREISGYSASDRLVLLGMGITAAIGEELIFRGFLQPIAIRRLGTIAGIAIIALAFAASHPRVYAWPPFFLTNILLIGATYGLLRAKDRPLTAPLLAHVLTWVVWGTA